MITAVPNSMLSEFAAKVCFKATLGGADAVVPTNTSTLIPFNTAAINVGDHFATGTSRFTPPAGVYRLSLRGAQATTVAAGEGIRVSIFKNGSGLAVFPRRGDWRSHHLRALHLGLGQRHRLLRRSVLFVLASRHEDDHGRCSLHNL